MTMEAQSYEYNLGCPVNLKAAAKSLDYLNYCPESGAATAELGALTARFLPTGKVHVFARGGGIQAVEGALVNAGIKLHEIFKDIKKATGAAIDPKAAYEGGCRTAVGSEVNAVLRPNFKSDMDVMIYREMLLASYDFMQAFHTERVATAAGENIGRAIVNSNNYKTPAEVEAEFTRFFAAKKVGRLVRTENAPAAPGLQTISTFILEESGIACGLPPMNQAMCHLARGIIRGAYCAYMGLENIGVKETECWALGDMRCKFHVFTYSR
jgi:predicted hydrocarbon binding protein